MDNFESKKLQFSVFAPCQYNYKYTGNEKYLIKKECFNKFDRLCFKYKYNKVLDTTLESVNVTDYDLLHAHSLFSNGYIAYKIYKKYGIPYVVAVRNTDINVFFKYFINLKKLGIDILMCASRVIFISPTYKEITIKKYIPKKKQNEFEKKCVVIPNGIDDFWLNNLNNKKRDINNKKLNLVYTGRIDKNKNIITTIKCCDKILSKKYEINLTVIGDIANKKYLNLLNKYDFVNYVGKKNKQEIKEIYRNMDLFVMPSKHETFGLVYVEAMSQGLPVIYTKGQGIDKYFPDGFVGYPIKYNDYDEMANYIDLILDNYDDTSLNCVNSAKQFNWNNIADKYIELYNLVCRR